MNRLVALGAVLAFVSVCHTTPQISTVVVDHGKVDVGIISGATFGPGTFSISHHGSSQRGKTHVYVSEDGDSEHTFIQATNHRVQQDNNRRPQHDSAELNNSGGTNSGNTQLCRVKPLTTLFNTGQAGIPGQGGSEESSVVIGTVVLPNHENNKENKANKQPDALNASAIEATYASNNENNGLLSTGVAFSSGASVAIGITGSNFGQGTLSLKNKKPRAIVPQQQSAANNGDIGYQNTGNEAPFSIGHDVSVYRPDASVLEAIFGTNSVNNELSSVGSGGPGSVAIGAITGGHFREGNLSLNNKRPGTNVTQQQSAANNEDIGYQNTEKDAPFSLDHGVSVYRPDASVLEAIFGTNSGNNELSSVGNGGPGSVAILNNKRPGANVPQEQSAANNGDIGYQNTGNEVPFSIGHDESVYRPDASVLEAIFGSNSGNNDLSSAGNGGQGSVAIGAITGGHFEEGTLSLNNKRPVSNVPQQQSAANNGDIGYQNSGNEVPFSIVHDESVYRPDASVLEAVFGSNSGNKEISSAGNGGQGSVAIGAITGGHFEEGTLSLNNKRPVANVPQQQSAANNGDVGYQNTGNEVPFSIVHDESVYRPDASVLEAIFGSNSGNKELSSAGNGGQGSVAIGAITGGHFEEGTLSLNNKRPVSNVPQQQSAANNGDIGYQNSGNEVPFSIVHDESVYRPDASVLEALFGSNSGNNDLSSAGNGGQGSVAIGAMTGGHFEEGTLSLNNKRPVANVPQQQSAANNGDVGYQNTGNEVPFSIVHDESVYRPDASVLDAIFGSNSGNKELSSAGNGGQGSVAIGAITGGHFEEGTLSLNNKRPVSNVPQQQSAANNGDVGYQNTGNEVPFSIVHDESVYRPDASVLEAIFGSNSGNKELSSAGNGGQGSVAIGAITRGHFEEGTLSLNNKRPVSNVPQQQSAANNGDIGYQNSGNEVPFSIVHDESVYRPDASVLEAIFGSNSGNKELSSAGNGGQGSVAIGAITRGHFEEGALSLNNKRPVANVPQQQSAANNGDVGYQNTGNEAPFSIGHGANSNGNGNAGVGYNDGQSSTGYNAYSNDEPWIWNRQVH